MFFKKKKQKKIDPKVMFQNRQFNQKLHQARNFKRTAKPVPEGSFGRFLKRIGMDSIWKQILLGLVVAGILYLVYIPNFLTLQSINIKGMSDSDRSATEGAIRASLGNAPFYNPQRNLLFLSKRRIREAAAKIPGVNSIDIIDKDFKTHSVNISITSKYEKFLVRSSEHVYDVYNDGTTKGVAGVDRNYWEGIKNPGMVKVEVPAKITNADNKEFLDHKTVSYITELQDNIKGIIGSQLVYVKISLPEFRQPAKPVSEDNSEDTTPEATGDTATEAKPQLAPEVVSTSEINLPINADELEIIMQKGDSNRTYRVIVDTKENAHDLVQRLNLLLSQTAPDRFNNLTYIDLRIQNRAFICVVGAACN